MPVPQTQGDQALIIEITDGSEGSNAEKYLNVNRAVAVRESGYIRGAVARDRRVVCGIGAIYLSPDTFGPIEYTQDVLQLETLRQFFSFLQNRETVELVVRTRTNLAQLEQAYEEGKKQIQGDESENTVFKVLREEFSVQHGALQSSLEIAEKNLPAMGLTTTGTLVFLVACQMFDCREAAATLVDLIVSDFDSYARLEQWSNPWLEQPFQLLVQRVPEGQLAAHPAPQSRMGHVPALEVSRCAPPTDTVLQVDILPEKRVAAPVSIADRIKRTLKTDDKKSLLASQEANRKKGSDKNVQKRGAVRLREREKALAELRQKFYETPMPLEDSGPEYSHPDPESALRSIAAAKAASGSSSLQLTAVKELAPSHGSLPGYYGRNKQPNIARSNRQSHVSTLHTPTAASAARGASTSPQSQAPEAAAQRMLSPKAAGMASPAKVRQSNALLHVEAKEMREQASLMLNAVKRKMDNIFAEANTIQDEAVEVEKGQQYVQRLDGIHKEIPQSLWSSDTGTDASQAVLYESHLNHKICVSEQTRGTAQQLSDAPAAIRSHHNLFGQFQYKCVALGDLVKRVIDRAEAVHGPELLEQYRADQKLIGFEESKVAVKPRVMGSTGAKNRRLGQASRAGRKVTGGRV